MISPALIAAAVAEVETSCPLASFTEAACAVWNAGREAERINPTNPDYSEAVRLANAWEAHQRRAA